MGELPPLPLDDYEHARVSSPKVDETEHESGDDGKVGKVETHGRSGGDGKGDVVSRANGTVECDGSGDDNVTDGTDGQLLFCCLATSECASLHGTGRFSPTETERDLPNQLVHRSNDDLVGGGQLTQEAACCMVPILAPSDSQRKR